MMYILVPSLRQISSKAKEKRGNVTGTTVRHIPLALQGLQKDFLTFYEIPNKWQQCNMAMPLMDCRMTITR